MGVFRVSDSGIYGFSKQRSFEIVNNPSGIIARGGNEIKTINGIKYHIFTSSGEFSLLRSGTVQVMAAGGGGSGANRSGGGGAGELDLFTSINLPGGIVSITVGLGGTPNANSGGQSSFGSYVSALGGGGGGTDGATAASGGSGGGGGSDYYSNSGLGGAANGSNTNAGGRGAHSPLHGSGGGGGGATAAGGNGSANSNSAFGGNGGQGYTLTSIDSNLTSANFSSFSGMTVICSGGGGGAVINPQTDRSGGISAGQGGTGAGRGRTWVPGIIDIATTAATSYGSGGGGGGDSGATGGYSGIVIVKYSV